jgi:hypothetical protein
MSDKILRPHKQEFEDYYLGHTTKQTAERFAITARMVERCVAEFNVQKHGTMIDIQLPPKQLELISGSMLGDGSLCKVISQRNSHFSESHSLDQEGYLKWKYDLLAPLCKNVKYGEATARKVVEGKVIYDPSRKCQFARIDTLRNAHLTKLEKVWYLRDGDANYILDKKGWRIKRLPEELVLTPFMLYVWYMDDGENMPYHRAARINSQSFTELEVERLMNDISRLGFKCKKNSDKSGFVIRIRSHSYEDFIGFIKSFNPPQCMQYKCSLDGYTPSSVRHWEPLSESDIDDAARMRYVDGLSLTDIAKSKGTDFRMISAALRKREDYRQISVKCNI